MPWEQSGPKLGNLPNTILNPKVSSDQCKEDFAPFFTFLLVFLDIANQCTTVNIQQNSCRQLSVIVNLCRCECPDSCPAYVTCVPLPFVPEGTHSLSDHAGTCLVKAGGNMPLIRSEDGWFIEKRVIPVRPAPLTTVQSGRWMEKKVAESKWLMNIFGVNFATTLCEINYGPDKTI